MVQGEGVWTGAWSWYREGEGVWSGAWSAMATLAIIVPLKKHLRARRAATAATVATA